MRNLWINLHLYMAAFFAPTLLLLAISGGLYRHIFRRSRSARS